MLDDKLSVLLAAQESERKRLERDDTQKARETDERVAQLEKTLQQLQYVVDGCSVRRDGSRLW